MAAPVFDAASQGTSVTSTTMTWNHTVGSGSNRVLVVGVLINNTSSSVSSISWNSTESLTKLTSAINQSARVELWYRVAPSSGTHSIQVTLSASGPFAAGAASYTGASQNTNPFGTPASATGTGTSASVTVSSTDATMTILTISGDQGAGGYTAGTGVTARWTDGTYANGAQGDKAGAATSTSVSWSLSSSDSWVIIGAALQTAASATTVTKTITSRFLLRVQKTSTLGARFIERVQQTRTLGARFIERTQKSVTIGSRFLERVGINKIVQSRAVIRVQRTLTAPARFVLQKVGTTKTIAARFIQRVLSTKTLQSRFRLRIQATRTLGTRFIERTQKSLTIGSRFLERIGVTRSLQHRFLLRVQRTVTVPARLVMRRYTLLVQARVRLRTLRTLTLQTRARIATNRTLVAPARFVERTLKSISVPARLLLRTLISKSLQARVLLRAQGTKTQQVRFVERTLKTVTLQFRFKLPLPATTKNIVSRFLLRNPNSITITFRFRLAGTTLASGGFTLYASGSGTASFDSVRVTQFPDPSLSLAPITPRVGATSILWNANIPINTTLGMDLSTDGVNWTDVTSQNGGTFPGIFSQPDPVIDGFRTNTSANYTSTYKTGGSTLTTFFDTSNSRLVLTGGSNAVYLYSAIRDNDIDFFVDMDRSDAGGMVWRYVDANNFYFLQIGDSLASAGTPNTITLYKVAANVQTQLASAPISYTVGNGINQYTVRFTRGTYRRFRVSMLGGTITVYVDGMQLMTYTDGSPLASGQMGLYNNGGTVGSRYYQLWMVQIGDYVSGTPAGDTVTGRFVYTRQRLASTDPSVSPQVLDLTTNAFTPMISPGVTIPAITYNASFLNKNFDDLAKQSNFSWYIDQNKNFVFRAGATVAAPWILQSAPAGLVTNVDLEVDTNLELDVANDLYRNRQIILGATSTTSFAETKTGDGSTRTFTLGYPLAAAPTLTLNGIAKTNIGLKGTTGHDYYYALNDPIITQDPSTTVLQNSDSLAIAYTGVTTTTVIVDNVPEQQARAAAEGQGTGIVEAVEDHTGENLTVAAATTLAQQLIARYAIAGRTLIFQTSRNGLAIGQTLTIFLPEHGIVDGQFLINQIEIFLQKGTQDTQTWWYKVTASELPKQDSWAKLVASGLGLQ